MFMKSRDITLNAIDDATSKVPFNPFIMHLGANLIDVNYSKKYCMDANKLVEGQIKAAKIFGIDHVNVSTDAYTEASAWGVKLYLEGHTPVVAKNGSLKLQEFDAIDEPNLLESPRTSERVKAIRFLRGRVPDQCVVGWIEAPFAALCSLFGMMPIIRLIRNKERSRIFRKLLERILPIQIEYAKMQIEAGADIIGAGDSAISQIGPRNYKNITYEATKRLFRHIGKITPTIYHTCGDNSGIDSAGNDMLELIANAGSSVLDIDFQVDLLKAMKKTNHKVCLRGNTNTTLLGDKSIPPSDIIADIESTIQIGKKGRYMYAAGCEWPWHPLEIAVRNISIAKTIVEK